MAAVTIRNLPDEVHRALKARAASRNRSAEAEIREILETAVMPKDRLKLGSALWEISREYGLTNTEVEAFQETRDKSPSTPMTFE